MEVDAEDMDPKNEKIVYSHQTKKQNKKNTKTNMILLIYDLKDRTTSEFFTIQVGSSYKDAFFVILDWLLK